MKLELKYIILFILMALGLSYPIQQGHINEYFQRIVGNSIISDSGYLLAGISTFTAALAALMFHKNISTRITILGDDKAKNILILSLPLIAFSICGISNNYGMNKSAYGFIYASINIVYAFAEEFGWRKYLQNALEGLNKNVKYIIIGIVWWIWHFRYNTQFDIFIFPLICLGGGFLLGKLADDTKSILPVVSMHTVIILVTNSGNFNKQSIISIIIVIVGWTLVEQLWQRKMHITKAST